MALPGLGFASLALPALAFPSLAFADLDFAGVDFARLDFAGLAFTAFDLASLTVLVSFDVDAVTAFADYGRFRVAFAFEVVAALAGVSVFVPVFVPLVPRTIRIM